MIIIIAALLLTPKKPQLVVVGNMIGYEQISAKRILEEQGFIAAITEAYSETVAAGIVVYQSLFPESEHQKGTNNHCYLKTVNIVCFLL